MQWVLTISGMTAGTSGSCTCTGLNGSTLTAGAFAFESVSGAVWYNLAARPWTGRMPKTGSTVCVFTGNDFVIEVCGGGGVQVGANSIITVYLGNDDKWYMQASIDFIDTVNPSNYFATLAGEQVFSGGGAAMNCGTPGEATPSFSLSVTLTPYFESAAVGYGCYPPTAVLVEGNPQ